MTSYIILEKHCWCSDTLVVRAAGIIAVTNSCQTFNIEALDQICEEYAFDDAHKQQVLDSAAQLTREATEEELYALIRAGFAEVYECCAAPPDAISLAAVKQNGSMLRYVKNQTEALCLEAVKQRGCALEYVKNQTEAICLAAVRRSGFALEYVKNQTEALCLEAVRQSGYALQYVENQTEALCLEAVRQDATAMSYVEKRFLIGAGER